jgi:hypothetical protein
LPNELELEEPHDDPKFQVDAAMADGPMAANVQATMIRPQRFARTTDSEEEQDFLVFMVFIFPGGLTKATSFLLIITNSKIQASKKIFIHFNGLKPYRCSYLLSL